MFGDSSSDKIAQMVADLINRGISIDDILLIVGGLYIGEYYQKKNPSINPAQIGPLSEKEIGPYAQRLMNGMAPFLGLNPTDKKTIIVLMAVVNSLLHTVHGAGANVMKPNQNPGQFDPNLDRPVPGMTLDKLMRDIRRDDDGK